MFPPPDLIRQIQKILDSEDLSIPEYKEVARQFQEQYNLAKARILKCKSLISERRREDAVAEALKDPDLREISSNLHFKELLKWKNICQEQNWPIPELYESQFNAALQDVFSSDNKIFPLLTKYRRAALKNDFRRSVQILRQIKKTDWSNKKWDEDLKEFEKSRMAEIRNHFVSAVRNRDHDYIAYLLMELEEEWSIPRDDLLYKEIKEHVLNHKKKEVMRNGKEICARMVKAYRAKDFSAVEKTIEEYESLRKDPLFDNQEMDRAYIKISFWIETVKKENELKEAAARENESWSEAIFILEQNLKMKNVKNVMNCLKELEQYSGKIIPPELGAEADALIKKWKFKRKVTFSLVILVFILCAGLALAVTRYHQIQDSTLADLESAYKAEDLPHFLEILKNSENTHRFTYNSNEIQKWASKIPDLTAIVAKKRAIFEETITRVKQMQDNDFYGDEEKVEQLLHAAEINAVDNADKGIIASIKEAWEIHKDLIINQNDRNLNKILNAVSIEIEKAETSLDHIHYIEANGYLFETEKLLIQAAEIENVSPKLTDDMKKIRNKYENLRSDLHPKIKQLEIISGAPTLSEYLTELKAYVTALPDDPLSRLMNSIISDEKNYYDLISMQSYNPANPFWYPVAEIFSEIKDNISTVKKDITNLQADKWYTDLWEYPLIPAFNKGNKKVFSEGNLVKKNNDDGVGCFTGFMYVSSSSDSEPEFVQGELITAYFDTTKKVEKLSHCKILYNDFEKILEAPPDLFAETMLTQMQNLLNEDLHPLLKVSVMKNLVRSFTDLMEDNAMEDWEDVLSDLNGFESPVHWLCFLNPALESGNKRAKRILDKHFEKTNIISTQKAKLELIRKCLKRSIKWVGSASFEGNQEILWKQSNIPSETWVVRASSKPSIYLAQEIKNEKLVFDYVSYLPGEPVFAPDDMKTSREILKEVFSKNELSFENHLSVPSIWPINLKANDL